MLAMLVSTIVTISTFVLLEVAERPSAQGGTWGEFGGYEGNGGNNDYLKDSYAQSSSSQCPAAIIENVLGNLPPCTPRFELVPLPERPDVIEVCSL